MHCVFIQNTCYEEAYHSHIQHTDASAHENIDFITQSTMWGTVYQSQLYQRKIRYNESSFDKVLLKNGW